MNDIMTRIITTKLFVFFSFLYFLSLILSSSAEFQPDVRELSARGLDVLLQDCAFKALSKPITGVSYDAEVPSKLNGIKVSSMRLRSDSLMKRGLKNYKDFEIPSGVVENPYVERLVLIHQNLGNWSEFFYPLHGFTYVAPVLGLLAYNGTNLSASKLPELEFKALEKPILVNFNDVNLPLFGSLPKCVYFDLNGSVELSNVLPGNICSTFKQGHFSIVVESKPNPPSQTPSDDDASVGKKKKFKLRIVIPCLVGGVILLIILIIRIRKAKQRRKMDQLESEADRDEILEVASIGDTKVPLAMGTRTRPVIENDYVP